MQTALGTEAVKFNSPGAPQSSLFELSGLYVDADGIVFNAQGVVNEPATAMYAREIAAGRTAAPYIDWEAQAESQRKASVAEVSDFERQQTWLESMESNVATTAGEIPGRIVSVVGNAMKYALPLAGAFLLIELLHETGAGRARVRQYRRRAARVAYRRIAGE